MRRSAGWISVPEPDIDARVTGIRMRIARGIAKELLRDYNPYLRNIGRFV